MRHDLCQRWNNGRASYRPAGEIVIPDRYRVELLDKLPAKEFVERHHYSRSYPAARFSVGLFRADRLVGVAIFSVPMNQNAVTRWTGMEPEEGVELGRFVLLDEEPSNTETWFLSRAFRLLRDCKPQIKSIIAYSDPVERFDENGQLVKPGHVGTIYQAHNGAYVGRSSPRTLILAPSGTVLSCRALSKIRCGERGKSYAIEQLVEYGCPEPHDGESGADYVKRALSGLPRIRHPGNYVYAWPANGSLPYPKKSKHE